MRRCARRALGLASRSAFVALLLAGAPVVPALAQIPEDQGRPIGTVTTRGQLVVVAVSEAALGQDHLFDLGGTTLVFRPQGHGYTVSHQALAWDPDFGSPLTGHEVKLRGFSFPFSGQSWSTVEVSRTGLIGFGKPATSDTSPAGLNELGVSIDRFDALAEVAPRLVENAPLLCVFLKPRLSGARFVKELSDRLVLTWDLSEPWGGLLDFSWFKTVNRFQAVLHRDGAIEMSYQEIASRDGIVGVYPRLAGNERRIATLARSPESTLPAPLDLERVEVSLHDSTVTRVAFVRRSTSSTQAAPPVAGDGFRVDFAAARPSSDHSAQHATWLLTHDLDGLDPNAPLQEAASGPGVFSTIRTAGNAKILEGVLPSTLCGGDVQISVSVLRGGAHPQVVERLTPRTVRLPACPGTGVQFAKRSQPQGPFALAYEAFHYRPVPRLQDLACTVLGSLGDRFDFLAFYSDFRVDGQEASSPSDGPVAGDVTGTGWAPHDLAKYCTQGRFQLGYQQPVFVGANELAERPPGDAPVGDAHTLTFFAHALAEASADARPRPFDYAIGHLGHEVAHRWGAYVSAKVHGEVVPLGPVHWAPGLQAPVAFPYQLPIEASTLGGGVWQDNADGTYTLLRDGFFVPATGYSYLDLYLMGLIAPEEVPDFFLLTNLQATGKNTQGRRVYRAQRTTITSADVIAAMGPRRPDPDHSQRHFNTGIVLLVEPGKEPSGLLLERAEGIRRQWIEYWSTVTGHRAVMTTDPR